MLGFVPTPARADANAPEAVVTPRSSPGVRPRLEVTIVGAGNPSTGPVQLAWDGGAAEDATVTPYRAGPEPIAIAIVLDSQEVFAGNMSFEHDPAAQYDGVLMGFEHGLDQLHLAELAPTGSTIEVVTYSTGVEVRVPAEPLASLHGSQLGSEHDSRNRIGADMTHGIELALHDLDQAQAPIKLVFVVGDGNDTNGAIAGLQLEQLGITAKAHGVRIAAAIYKTKISADRSEIIVIAPDARPVYSGDDAAHALAAELDRLTDRMYVTFDDARLPWDGDAHPFRVTTHGRALAPVQVVMPDRSDPRHRWWLNVLLGAGVATLIAAALALRQPRSNTSGSVT